MREQDDDPDSGQDDMPPRQPGAEGRGQARLADGGKGVGGQNHRPTSQRRRQNQHVGGSGAYRQPLAQQQQGSAGHRPHAGARIAHDAAAFLRSDRRQQAIAAVAEAVQVQAAADQRPDQQYHECVELAVERRVVGDGRQQRADAQADQREPGEGRPTHAPGRIAQRQNRQERKSRADIR